MRSTEKPTSSPSGVVKANGAKPTSVATLSVPLSWAVAAPPITAATNSATTALFMYPSSPVEVSVVEGRREPAGPGLRGHLHAIEDLPTPNERTHHLPDHAHAVVRAPTRHRLCLRGGDRPADGRVEHGAVGGGADGERALARVEPVATRRPRGQLLREHGHGQPPVHDRGAVEQRQQVLDARQTRRVVEDVRGALVAQGPGGVVGRHEVHLAALQSPPQVLLGRLVAERRVALW